jgi:alkanesulfonate monooxygenase SsuD/methylene tetrahydromethanopterin reductase-like flavin-dependent oxidoreductase (luciferase family)
LIGWLLANTGRLRVFCDVAHLPLRPPAMLAKAAASLDLLSGGRFELGLGAGGGYAPSGAMGGQDRSPRESLDALAEAVGMIRAYWTEPSARFDGVYYSIEGIEPGPIPVNPIGIWIGAIRPRLLRLTGAISDGWAGPLPRYLPRDLWPAAHAQIDEGARSAGRDPRQVRRMAQLPGSITAERVVDASLGHEPEFRGDARQWIDGLAELALQERFDTFIFWPRPATLEQVERFANEIAPAVRAHLSNAGAGADPPVAPRIARSSR